MRALTLTLCLVLHARGRAPAAVSEFVTVMGQPGVRAVGVGALRPRNTVGPRVSPARPTEFQHFVGLTSHRARDSFPPPIPGELP